MGRFTDYAPIPNTCPTVNDGIRYIESVMTTLIKHEGEEFQDAIDECNGAISIFEDLRGANSQLREWGNELYQDKCELEKERDELEAKVSTLEAQVKYLANNVTPE